VSQLGSIYTYIYMVYGVIANKDRTAGVPARRKSVKATNTKPGKGKDIPTLKKYIFQNKSLNICIILSDHITRPIIIFEYNHFWIGNVIDYLYF